MQRLTMQRVLAVVGMIAAGQFVLYSAMTLHETAQAITSLQWQKWYAAKAAFALVIWEALALVFAGFLWRHAHRLVSVGCVVLLIAAVCFTFRLELINQIQGSADTVASRIQTITQAVTDKEQLDSLKKQRAMWTARLEKETLTQRDQRELRTQLDRLNTNIEEIIHRQNERPAMVEVTPEAALAARLLGGDEAHWRDMLSLMLIMFWPLARIIATPAAVAFWTIAFERTEGERIDAAFTLAKVARIEPASDALLKPDPVPQISAPKEEIPQEDNQKDMPSKLREDSQEDDQEGSLKDRQEDIKKEAKRPTPRQIKKAAKDDPKKVILGPFGQVGGKTEKPATSELKAVVASFCQTLEPGEYPIDALHKRISPRARKHGLNPAKRHIGEALRKLDFEPKKRNGRVVYLISGGASLEANRA